MSKKIRLADPEHCQLVSIAESLFRLANSFEAIESMARDEVNRTKERRREEDRRERDLTLGQWIKCEPKYRAMVSHSVKAKPGWRLATVQETRAKLKELKEVGVVEGTYHAANGGEFSTIPNDEIITVTYAGIFTQWRSDFDENAFAPFYIKKEG